jgi:hypothetical protein
VRAVIDCVTQSISLLALPAACVGIFLMIAFTIAFIVIHTLRCATSCRLCWAERRCETIVLNTCLGVSCFVMLCVSPSHRCNFFPFFAHLHSLVSGQLPDGPAAAREHVVA